MIYLQLFWSFFQIGLFSFGGGYAAMPLIGHQVVELNSWLSASQLADIVAISQMTPGPIAINAATFVGIRMAGIWGALVATLGCVLPSCTIALTLAYIYSRYRKLELIQGILYGLRPAVISMIASAGLSMLLMALWGVADLSLPLPSIDWIAAVIFGAGFLALRKWKPNPVIVMLGASALGVVLYSLLG